MSAVGPRQQRCGPGTYLGDQWSRKSLTPSLTESRNDNISILPSLPKNENLRHKADLLCPEVRVAQNLSESDINTCEKVCFSLKNTSAIFYVSWFPFPLRSTCCKFKSSDIAHPDSQTKVEHVAKMVRMRSSDVLSASIRHQVHTAPLPGSHATNANKP